MHVNCPHLALKEPYVIRSVEEQDIEELHELSKAIGWGSTYQEWKEDVLFAKDSSYVISKESKIVAVGLGLRFDGKARVASVIVHPEHQRLGLATQLVCSIVTQLINLGYRHVELEASDKGRALYERIGFKVVASPIVTCMKEIKDAPQVSYKVCETADVDQVVAVDTKVFSASRRKYIEDAFAKGHILVTKEKLVTGFLVYSEEENAIRIGPWIHEDSGGAKELLLAAIGVISKAHHSKKDIVIHIPKSNKVALEIIQALGFEMKFESIHMELGDHPPARQEHKSYALWSLGLG